MIPRGLTVRSIGNFNIESIEKPRCVSSYRLIRANLNPIKPTGVLSRAVAATNPILNQAGVIAYRILDGKVRVLLVTSRDTGRWIIPKGNIKAGEMPCEAAEKEAYEEAGVRGDHYRFDPARDVHLFQETGFWTGPPCNG